MKLMELLTEFRIFRVTSDVDSFSISATMLVHQSAI